MPGEMQSRSPKTPTKPEVEKQVQGTSSSVTCSELGTARQTDRQIRQEDKMKTHTHTHPP